MYNIEEYRNEYRRDKITDSYNGRRNVFFNVLFCCAVVIVSFLLLGQVTGLEITFVPLAFLLANLEEYSSHRWLGHKKNKYYNSILERHLKEHHRFFNNENMHYETDRDFYITVMPTSTILFYFFVLGLPFATIIYFSVSLNAALLVLITMTLFLLNLDLLHFYYHLPNSHLLSKILDKVKYLRHLKTNHEIHHDPKNMQKVNFNITYPIFDFIFKTRYVDVKNNQQLNATSES